MTRRRGGSGEGIGRARIRADCGELTTLLLSNDYFLAVI